VVLLPILNRPRIVINPNVYLQAKLLAEPTLSGPSSAYYTTSCYSDVIGKVTNNIFLVMRSARYHENTASCIVQ